MIVNINSIRESRGLSIPFEGIQAFEPDQFEGFNLVFEGPIAVKGKVTNTGDGFLVEAEARLRYRTACSRCLQEFGENRSIEVKEEFVQGHSSSDESVYGFAGDLIDLTMCLRDQIILALPMKFLCNPQCRGFCPECGKNLNLESCQCHAEPMNHQFAILKNLLSSEGGGSDGQSKK